MVFSDRSCWGYGIPRCLQMFGACFKATLVTTYETTHRNPARPWCMSSLSWKLFLLFGLHFGWFCIVNHWPRLAALLSVVWYVIGHVCCFTITAAVVSYSSDHVYCFTVLAAYCIARLAPCLHSFHLLGGTEENDWYLARIWTWDPSCMRRVCYVLCRYFRYCVRRIYQQEHLKPTEVFRVCFIYCLTSLRG